MHCGAVGQRLYGLYAMQEECGERFAGQLSDKVREKGFDLLSIPADLISTPLPKKDLKILKLLLQNKNIKGSMGR